MMPLNKKEVISCVLTLISFILAIAAVATHAWVIKDFAGVTSLGFSKMCILFHDDDSSMTRCANLYLGVRSHWTMCSAFIILGIFSLVLSMKFVFLPNRNPNAKRSTRIAAFFSMCCFCLAMIIFPFGFGMKEVGGVAYKLPANTSVGYSCFLLVASIMSLTAANVLWNFDALRLNMFFRF